MKEQLITFETAKLAKEKGFEIVTDLSYDGMGQIMHKQWNKFAVHKSFNPAPTQSLLQKWLREVHNIDVSLCPYGEVNLLIDNAPLEKTYTARVDNWKVKWSVHDGTGLVLPEHFHFCSSNYEDAFEQGLQEALKLI